MNDVAADWRIYTPASENDEYELFDGGLKNFFAENGEKAVGRIYFFPASSISFYLAESRYRNPSFRFVITAEFVGFSPEDVPTSRIPKISEFTHPDLLRRRA